MTKEVEVNTNKTDEFLDENTEINLENIPVDLTDPDIIKKMAEMPSYEELSVTDEEFREKVKEIYAKYNRRGIVIVQSGEGCIFSWIGLTTGGAVDMLQLTKSQLLSIIGSS